MGSSSLNRNGSGEKTGNRAERLRRLKCTGLCRGSEAWNAISQPQIWEAAGQITPSYPFMLQMRKPGLSALPKVPARAVQKRSWGPGLPALLLGEPESPTPRRWGPASPRSGLFLVCWNFPRKCDKKGTIGNWMGRVTGNVTKQWATTQGYGIKQDFSSAGYALEQGSASH